MRGVLVVGRAGGGRYTESSQRASSRERDFAPESLKRAANSDERVARHVCEPLVQLQLSTGAAMPFESQPGLGLVK